MLLFPYLSYARDGRLDCLSVYRHRFVIMHEEEEELSTAASASLQESETESPMKRYCTERSLSLFVVSKLKHLICRAAARLGSARAHSVQRESHLAILVLFRLMDTCTMG